MKQCGWALVDVNAENRTPEICLEAVRQHGLALQYVRNQTDEICLAAVRQNGIALGCVICQTFEICMEAVKQNESAIYYVRGEMLKRMVYENWKIMKHLLKMSINDDILMIVVKSILRLPNE